MTVAEKLRAVSPPYSKAEIQVIAEAAYNILYGVVLLTNQEKQYFKLHKEDIRVLVGNNNLNIKRKAITEELVEYIRSAALRHLDG